jgi:hypothetical protein
MNATTKNVPHQTLSNVQKIKKSINLTIMGWAIAILLALSLTATILINSNNLKIFKEDNRMVMELERMRIEDTLARIERINYLAYTNDTTKVFFINYAKDLINRHYLTHRIPEARRMSPIEKDEFLELIWEYASSGIYPSVGLPLGLFLPLSYALNESEFIPDAIGGDGERSVFQFMESTAREIYRRNGKTFVPDFWRHPREYVWLWFEYYDRHLAWNFVHEDLERHVRWTALAYNAGLYRNRLLHYFNQGWSIESYLRDFPLVRGIARYNRRIWEVYVEYREGFANVIPLD